MMSAPEKKKEPSIMERHIHTVLLSIITAGILFGSGTIWNLSMQVTTLSVKMDTISENARSFVTQSDIMGMAKVRDQQLLDFDKRISKLENWREKKGSGG